MAGMTGGRNGRRGLRTVAVPVTSARDGFEHLVADAAMTPGSAGRYVSLCGRSVWAAALACPPGPRCPACVAARTPDPAMQRRRHRQRRPGVWAWLSLVWRRRHRAARTKDGAPDAN
ncbi:MAG: hypothetical protein ACRDUV_24230 [Pseudonocardiaceae bacterium]